MKTSTFIEANVVDKFLKNVNEFQKDMNVTNKG